MQQILIDVNNLIQETEYFDESWLSNLAGSVEKGYHQFRYGINPNFSSGRRDLVKKSSSALGALAASHLANKVKPLERLTNQYNTADIINHYTKVAANQENLKTLGSSKYLPKNIRDIAAGMPNYNEFLPSPKMNRRQALGSMILTGLTPKFIAQDGINTFNKFRSFTPASDPSPLLMRFQR